MATAAYGSINLANIYRWWRPRVPPRRKSSWRALGAVPPHEAGDLSGPTRGLSKQYLAAAPSVAAARVSTKLTPTGSASHCVLTDRSRSALGSSSVTATREVKYPENAPVDNEALVLPPLILTFSPVPSFHPPLGVPSFPPTPVALMSVEDIVM
uniref:Uncharacterized protein n=1 Tax=Oryza barthii TaxID=65489 RepID=A0A0D3HC66_9ORYZ